ncbi:MAG: hypothetical protein EPO22_07380 [Dehalococcoidia bacterium]|nr:MAG: hypothetical protein EPO22_07380 [Dehalococcoidia bacterium]
MRSARLLRVIRIVRLTAFAVRAAESSREVLEERGLQYALATGAILFVAAAAAVTLFERGNGGNIDSFGDGIWWAAATVTTVGYGDRFPVTPEGRGIAVFLMLLGISLFSFTTANLSAFFVKPQNEEQDGSPTLADVMEQLRRLEAEIVELRLASAASGGQ